MRRSRLLFALACALVVRVRRCRWRRRARARCRSSAFASTRQASVLRTIRRHSRRRRELAGTAGHLDDALKTLVVLGGGVKVDGVAFASSVSRDMAQKLAGLPDAVDAPLGIAELARSFKGADVTLTTSSGSFSGRLVEVLEPGQGQLERCASTSDGSSRSGSEDNGCRLVQRGSLVVLTTSASCVGSSLRIWSACVRASRRRALA